MAKKGFLESSIDGISAIDTHTHIGGESRIKPPSVREMVFKVIRGSYFVSDLVSSGFAEQGREYSGIDTGKLIARYARETTALKATGPYSVYLQGLKDLHGFNGDFSDSGEVQKLIASIEKAYADGEQKRWEEVFGISNVQVAMKNVELPWFVTGLDALPEEHRIIERRLLRGLARVDSFLFGPFDLEGSEMVSLSMPWMHSALRDNMEEAKSFPESFDDYIRFVKKVFTEYRKSGAVGVKLTTGFMRPLRFDNAQEGDARRIYDSRNSKKTVMDVKPFQDYVFRLILDICTEQSLPMQIHTGLQAGNAANMPDCNPVLLTGLFSDKRYKKMQFVLLHGGYPYMGETGVLARCFPNVYLDFSWVVLLSTTACERWLGEWLELVPSNKLMHGSDVHTAEELYAVTKRIRKTIAKVLEDFIKNERLSTEDAVHIAKSILRDNANRIYRLELNN